MGLDSSGRLIGLSQTMKVIAMFRFINVNFGEVLGPFLEETGNRMEPKTKMSKNSIIQN